MEEIGPQEGWHRYFMELSYDGTDFCGWQIQPGMRTVQGVLQQALTSIQRGQERRVVGAGRTDTGVHARHFIAHTDLPHPLDESECTDLTERLSRMLPPDIALHRVWQVPTDAHARYSALSRTYHYHVGHTRDPFRRRYETYLRHSPDYDAMNAAARHLLGEHDFTTFSKIGSDVSHYRCSVMQAEWQICGADRAVFVFEANRFVRNMVRSVVGTLWQVGHGKISIEAFARALAACDRRLAASSAPPEGLQLYHISYPPDLTERTY